MEIKEFLNAMQDYTFEIDTASTGLSAAALLRKKNYKVVITGINLSTYDGTKLIAYLNAHCPQTACIVYTTRVDLAQLRLLVNKRDVFRIFLKPVNYRGDFYNAIRDGFIYHDMQEAEAEEQKVREQKQESLEMMVEEPGRNLSRERAEWNRLKEIVAPLTVWSAGAFALQLSEKDRAAISKYEQKILDYCFAEDYGTCDSLEEVRKRICREFLRDREKQSIEMETDQRPVNVRPGAYQRLHFMIWLVIGMIAEMSDSYHIKVKLSFRAQVWPVLQIRGNVDGKGQEQIYLTVICRIIEKLGGKCRARRTGDTISCLIQIRQK